MMLKMKLGIIPGVLAIVLLLVCQSALAVGTTGKIAGRILDAKTGQPLPGANVLVEGTSMGASADRGGYYFIVNIPVGTYSVTARVIGYKSVTFENSRSIQDLTTTLNFRLEQTVIALPGVVVSAERPMVQPDLTSTMHIISTEEMDVQPLRYVSDVVGRTAGSAYSKGGSSGRTGGIHIRGGRSEELVYFVDGMSIHDPVLGIRAADVNLNAVQEVVVQSGGFNAEYGQAMSGIVNLVTKEGGDKITGQLRYRTDAFLPDDYNQGLHLVEADFGGPVVPGYRPLRFFISGAFDLRDQFIAARYARKEGSELVLDEAGAMTNTDREYYSGQGKLSFNISPTMKFKVGGFVTRTQRGIYGEHADLPGTGQFDENGSKYKPLDQMLSLLDKSTQGHAIWSHAINQSSFYTLNLAYLKSKRTRGIRDQAEEDGRGFWEDYEFIPWWKYNIIEARSPSQRDTLWNEHDYYGEQYPWGVTGSTQWGFTFGNMGLWQERINESVEGRLDVTSQINNVHQIKVGASVKSNLKMSYEMAQYIYTRPDTTNKVIEECLYYDTYEVKPMEGSFYLQDKMEFEDLVINAGVRFDYFDAVDEMFKYPTGVDSAGDPDSTMVEPDPKYKVSPRLGVSFPVSERTALHLSYGRFFQMPQYRRLYANIDRPVRKLRGGWPLIGSPNLDAQSTTAYEIGLAHQLGQNTAINVTGYYKDMFDVLSTRLHTHPAYGYTSYESADYGNVKGVEFILKDRSPRYFSGQVSYALSVAKGTGSYSREAYYDYIANMPVNPYTGLPLVLPQGDYYLEFDRRHVLNANVNFRIPDGEGPEMGTMKPLQNLNLNLYTQAASGLPYTPRDMENNIVGTINSKRMPWNWTADLKAQKDFYFGPLTYSLFAEVNNLFNVLNIVNVYPTTGLPDDNGKMSEYGAYMQTTWPETFAEGDSLEAGADTVSGVIIGDPRRDLNGDGWISKQEWYQSYVNAYKDWLLDPFNFGPPRRIAVGLSISW